MASRIFLGVGGLCALEPHRDLGDREGRPTWGGEDEVADEGDLVGVGSARAACDGTQHTIGSSANRDAARATPARS